MGKEKVSKQESMLAVNVAGITAHKTRKIIAIINNVMQN